MSRLLTVRVCDSSGKDLLQATELVDVPFEGTFRDVLNDLPGDFDDRTPLEVFVREYEGAPDLSSLKLRAGFLDKSLAKIDLILQQHRKPWPDHATLSVKLRALYCKQPLRKLEKLHAGRRAVVPVGTGSDSDSNACNNGDAADGNGSDGIERGSAIAEENLSQRDAVVDGDADGAAAAGSSGHATESMQPQAQSASAHSTHARRRSQRAAAAATMVQDATDSDSSQSASESDVTQDDADMDAHADSGSNAVAETDASADEEADADAPAHADACAGADARAALPLGGASKRKRGRPRVAKRGRPAGKAGRASAHGPGTYGYDEVRSACDSGLYTCGAM
jgi:hypothetical protein